MRLSTRLPLLATIAIGGLALATVLPSAVALGATATATTQAPLWVAHQFVTRGGFNIKVAASPDGSAVFVAGEAEKLNHKGTNATVTAVNATTGAMLWQTQYTASPNSGFSEVAVSPDGSTVFAAAAAEPTGGGPFGALIVAFNAATGSILWTAGQGTGSPVDSLAVSPDGSVVFTTGSAGTIAYDAATGTALWTAGGGLSVAVAPDGSAVYVASSVPVTQKRSASLTTAYDAATGATLWASRFNVPKGTSGADAVAASPDGTAVFVTGETTAAGQIHPQVSTVAYNAATGARMWARIVHATSIESAIAASPDGSTVYVLNSANTSSGGTAYATEAYAAANGATRWTARYQGPVSGGLTIPQDLAASPDGARVYVTGHSPAPGGQDQFATVAYDAATGAVAWVVRYGHATQNSAGEGVAVTPDSSKVYVTGDTATYGTTIGYSS